jgi:hypothetical protein
MFKVHLLISPALGLRWQQLYEDLIKAQSKWDCFSLDAESGISKWLDHRGAAAH